MSIALLLFLISAGAERPAECPIIGAIRWDGWFPGNPWEKNLAPKEWRYRLPFYGKIAEDGSCQVCSDSQETMDREIAHAKAGGIAYWAFCYYHPKSWPQADAYNYGWRRYLKSERKKDVNFCLLLQGGSHLGPAAEWAATVGEFVGHFKEPTYQRVCGDRPLLYVFACEHLIPHFGSPEAAGKAFALLREESRKAGTGDPYIVAQIWTHQIQADFLDAIRFDALGAYSAQGGKGGKQSYADLIESNRSYWERYKASGREVAPTVNAGWDGRPRNYDGPWYEQGTPREIAAAVKGAFDWIRANEAVSPARTVLVYAWNEHDEGGWLCPTLEEGAARLEAIRAMRDAYKP
ncbi:MAG TPA: glycoside hydrolase family 99-like domain-containing protein [Candidatus Hydrogenedentes bacterium]|nr:glycoside hydrolase family 99-like domain-containing protein [Candidatus Hydrogenedentota bacterium]HOV73508.1 glycoside hydrolase family 99-like domain-containing protein [Candidatus Hydrogenedentota bacterium]